MINEITYSTFRARVNQWRHVRRVQVVYYPKDGVAAVYTDGVFRNMCAMQRVDFENFFAKEADEVVRSYDCDRVFFN